MTAAPESLRPGVSRLYPSTPGAIIEALTVVVLTVVLIGLGVRYATATSANAGRSAATSQIAALAPAIEAYYLDHQTYVGMTPQALGLASEGSARLSMTFSGLSAAGFCVQVRDGDRYVAQNGPHDQIRSADGPLCP